MSKDTGGPAFPIPNTPDNVWAEGMTLRDYFAAKAMQGLISRWRIVIVEGKALADYPMAIAVEISYKAADAMLAERNR